MEIEAVEKIFQKKSKKSEPFGAFLERYLFGEINNISHARKEKIGNNGKKSDYFWIFVEDTYTKPPGGNVNNNAQ